MGCNILLLVVLLCGWPPEYITVLGYHRACQKNETLVHCLTNETVPEKRCPNVGSFCVPGQQVCACGGSLYRSGKNHICVEYKDCVPKKHDILLFLRQRMSIYLVGVTNIDYPKKLHLPLSCLRSLKGSLSSRGTEVSRPVEYEKHVKDPMATMLGCSTTLTTSFLEATPDITTTAQQKNGPLTDISIWISKRSSIIAAERRFIFQKRVCDIFINITKIAASDSSKLPQSTNEVRFCSRTIKW
uniref:Lipocalin n=1 Tax=Rhipicephalus zambeziensis TaxID=60191 RepID=A0A224YLE6_9ACAR